MERGKFLWAQITLLSTTVVAMVVSLSAALYVKDADGSGSYGEIALRSYFHSGDGKTLETAYTITRPQHMYNLSRLQSLGVFKEKTYFKLGTTALDPNGLQPMCYGPDNVTPVPFLDMSDSNYNSFPINAIGSESVPFYGEFDGQGLELKNLKVYADPEDAGLFGYTAHGSKITNLFLDNVTINALGYTTGYSDLYGSDSTLSSNVYYSYTHTPSSISDRVFNSANPETTAAATFDATGYFAGDASALPANPPFVVAHWPSASQDDLHDYSLLVSGDFLSLNKATNTITVNFSEVFKLFKTEKEKEDVKTPLLSSSSVSIIASRTDADGLDHSKVLTTLNFNFSLASKTSNSISMEVRIGNEHTNNIGLIAGHCDGTIRDVYVHDGKFNINNNAGGTVSGTYTPMENGSSFGLIGLVGNSVHDVAAENSDSATKTGKDIGVLDFTTIYDDIVGDGTFPSPDQTLEEENLDGIKYYPLSSSKYLDYLRYHDINDDFYVTKEKNYVSLRGKQVVWNTDLGIFTVVTDPSIDGIVLDVDSGFTDLNPTSTIHKEDDDVDYLYYAMGEYSSKSGIPFSEYRDSLETNTPSTMLVGHHFPKAGELSVEGFEQREWHQNYIFRFQIDKNYRDGLDTKRLYFSDVDTSTDGGAFISSYFQYKLRDQSGLPIPENNPKSGVMLRDFLNHEIDSFSASFTTPDYSFNDATTEILKPRMWCLDDESAGYPAANMINFEIKTEVANVTVVAAPNESKKAAALGVYRTDIEGVPSVYSNKKYIPCDFENPDYAFFMPKEEHLAYFDYAIDDEKTNDIKKGQIGTYPSASAKLVPATDQTNATVPAIAEPKAIDQPRLFVHTFTLEKGHYCLGAATGANSNVGKEGTQTIPKIYYICAQGQTDGQLQFDDNAFASNDVVDDVDFLKTAKYSYNSGTKKVTTNITTGPDSAWSAESTLLQHQRCYISFVKSDRSLFGDGPVDLRFEYAGGKFRITTETNTDNITRIVVSSYGKSVNSGDLTGLVNTVVSLLDLDDSDADRVVFPTS